VILKMQKYNLILKNNKNEKSTKIVFGGKKTV
jgi:hypothetical protein